jgi:hypothetical protein
MSTIAATDSSRSQTLDPRVERAKSAIAFRLRAVCAGMPAEEFDALMEHMAEVQIKYTPADVPVARSDAGESEVSR